MNWVGVIKLKINERKIKLPKSFFSFIDSQSFFCVLKKQVSRGSASLVLEKIRVFENWNLFSYWWAKSNIIIIILSGIDTLHRPWLKCIYQQFWSVYFYLYLYLYVSHHQHHHLLLFLGWVIIHSMWMQKLKLY